MQHADLPEAAAAICEPNKVAPEDDAAGCVQQDVGTGDASLRRNQQTRRQSAMVEEPSCVLQGAGAQDLPAAARGLRDHAGHALSAVRQDQGLAEAPEAGQAQQQGAAAKQPGFLPFPGNARRARSQPAGAQLHR